MGKLPDALRGRITWLDDEVGVIPPEPGLAEPEAPPEGPRRGPRPARAEGPTKEPGWPHSHALVVDDGDVLMVGAGVPSELARDLAAHTDALLLAHAHVDHFLHAHAFPTVWAPGAESEALATLDGFCHVHGVQRADRPVVRDWLSRNGYAPAKVTRAFQPGSVLRLATTTWHLLTLPGLSPGYTCLYEPDRRILYAPVLEGHVYGVEAPFYGFPACDLDGIETMIQRLEELEVAYLVGSHAPVRRRGIRNLFKRVPQIIKERDTRVLEAFDTPASLSEIAERHLFFPNGGPDQKREPVIDYWERTMADKHVANLLERDLLAARQDGRFERV